MTLLLCALVSYFVVQLSREVIILTKYTFLYTLLGAAAAYLTAHWQLPKEQVHGLLIYGAAGASLGGLIYIVGRLLAALVSRLNIDVAARRPANRPGRSL